VYLLVFHAYINEMYGSGSKKSANPLVGIFHETSQCVFTFRCSPVDIHKFHCYMERNLPANIVVNTFGIFTCKTQRSNLIVWEQPAFVVAPVLVT
jgi:hypothetical protein